MEANFNLGTLKIVHKPLKEYLEKIHKDIDKNIDLIKNEQKAVTNFEFIDTLNKVQSTLKMIGLNGLVETISLIIDTSKELKNVKYRTDIAINVWELNKTLLIDIENYIEQLVNGELDQPVKLFNKYNELANIVNKKVNVKDLFYPKLEIKNISKELQSELRVGHLINNKNKEILLANLIKSKELISNSINELNEIISKDKGQNLAEEQNVYHTLCKKIYEVLEQLQNQKISKSYYTIFVIQKLMISVMSPIFNENFAALLGEHSDEMKLNLEFINTTLNNLIKDVTSLENGEKTGSLKVDDKISKENLFFTIITIKENKLLKNMPSFKNLIAIFDYDFYEEQLAHTSFKASVTQVNPNLSIEIENKVTEIIEHINIITSKNTSVSLVAQYLDKFENTVITLKQLTAEKEVGSYTFNELLGSILEVLNELKNKKIEFSESIKKELSTSVLLIQNSINTFIKDSVSENAKLDLETQFKIQSNRLKSAKEEKSLKELELPKLDLHNKEVDEKKALAKMFEEMGKDIRKIEEVFDSVIRTNEIEREDLISVLPSLKTLSGVFKLNDNNIFSEMLIDIQNVWLKINDEGLSSIDKVYLNKTISWLSGISLFISSSENNNIIEAEEIEDKIIIDYNLFKGNNFEQSISIINFEELGETGFNKENEIVIKEEDKSENITTTVINKEENILSIINEIDSPEEVVETPILETKEIIEEINKHKDMPKDFDLLEIFLEELQSVKDELSLNVDKLKSNKSDLDIISNLRRSFHTIKGSGKMVGLYNLSEIAWILEQELNTVLNKQLSINDNVFDAINFIQEKLNNWLSDLKENKSITENFEEVENTLKYKLFENTVEKNQNIVETKKESINVEKVIAVETTKESKSENVLINDKNISSILLSDYDMSSVEHVNKMIDLINDSENAVISDDFISHAHILSVESKKVNFNFIANLTKELESFAIFAVAKNIIFDKVQIDLFKSTLNDLFKFKKEDNKHVVNKYNEIISHFEKNKLIMKKENEVLIPSESLKENKEDIEKLLEGVISKALNNFSNTIDSLKEEIKEIKIAQKEKPTISQEEVVKDVLSKIGELLNNKNENLLDAFKKYDENINKKNDELSQAIDSIKKNIEDLSEEQKDIKKTNKQGIDNIRKNLFALGEIVKKKSSESYQSILGDEVNQVFSDIGLDNDSLFTDFTEYNNDEMSLLNNSYIQAIFDDSISSIKDEFDNEIYQISKEEIKEMFIKVEDILEDINIDILDVEKNNTLKRYLHTLKGSVRMSGANRMGAIAHRLESLLDYSENHDISLFKMKSLLNKEIAKLHFLEKNINRKLNSNEESWLDSVLDNPVVIEESSELTIIDKDSPKEDKQYIRIISSVLDTLINEAGEMRLSRTTLEGTLTNNKRLLLDIRNSSSKLSKMLKEIEVQSETQISARKDALLEVGKDFDPLELDRFTRLQELARFMNETVTDIKDSIDYLEKLYRTQESAVIQQSIVTNNMLDFLMKIRLIPVDTITQRLYKITRNTSKEMAKLVNLEITGEKTEMDRLVLERIQSPLEHLVRNCIAHGIESSGNREKSGKPVSGKIKIDISQDGNFIIIKVSDDGAGINIAKVKNLGLERGLIEENIIYSDEEIIDLIFRSGFSTADSLSQISGRGVGMDIVKNEIFSLGGSIKTESAEGKGTSFTIILPVAVATTQAMLTEASGKLVAIPAILVDQVISMKQNKLNIAYEEGIVNYNDVDYPLYYLGHLMGTVSPVYHPEVKFYNTLLLISYLDQKIVVHVDKLETTDEILIKQMGQYFGKILGLLGATLLGDGRQGVVINPILLKDHFNKNLKKENGEKLIQQEESLTKSNLTIMVVDDSVTVRRATSKLLEKYGYNVVLAKDGEDGLEKLQISIPDIILSDIEMPNMDGFEFVKNIKNIEKYKKIPIIMITSRTAEKHKNLAYSLGVEGFLGKPYQEDDIIKHILNLTRK